MGPHWVVRYIFDSRFHLNLQGSQADAVSTGEMVSTDSHIHPLDAARFHLQQLEGSRSRTPTSTEVDASYMGYVRVTLDDYI